MADRSMRTGQVAAAAGVNVETLRYYERRGILAEPRRRRSGYREYPPETVRIVRFIKRAQDLGFTLDEVEQLLALRDDGTRTCGEVRAAASVKINEIDLKLKRLRAMKRALTTLMTSCVEDASTRACPILESLDDERTKASE